MKCPACNRPLTVQVAFSSTKGDNGKRLVYSYRYLTCGAHAWQTDQQQEEMYQKRDALKRGAFQKKNQQ
jgi:hypothetical protein